MANFRPKETVFEAFAAGNNKDIGITSQVDKGRTTGVKKHASDSALAAMKNMRRQLRIARDKGSALVVAGSVNAKELNGNEDEPEQGDALASEESELDQKPTGTADGISATPALKTQTAVTNETKRRLSRAERRRLKKDPNATVFSPTTKGDENQYKYNKPMRGADFRDPAFFIDNHANPAEAQRQRQVEAAMQPSASVSAKGSVGAALRLEEAMLDIVGDENEELVQKQRMMRWDKSKRKYVQTTVGAELSGESYRKRLKLESGQTVKSDKMKLGEIYEKWQKRTNRSIGRTGVFDDPVDGNGEDEAPAVGKGKRGGGKGTKGALGGEKQKSAQAIKKERDQKQKMKVKNMKKGDRRRLERSQKPAKGSVKSDPKKGFQGKKGTSGRWGNGGKGKKK